MDSIFESSTEWISNSYREYCLKEYILLVDVFWNFSPKNNFSRYLFSMCISVSFKTTRNTKIFGFLRILNGGSFWGTWGNGIDGYLNYK